MKLRGSFSSVLFAACSLLPLHAHAEVSSQEKALASRLFDEASKLMSAGQTARACDKYAESKRLDPQLGTMLYLGECYAKIGRTASAWASFKEAADIAAQRGDARTAKIRERISSVETTLSNLTIVVADTEPADLEVRQDGAIVGKAAWGTSIPVDPGEHSVTATSPGAKPREVKAVVSDGARSVTVNLPAIEYLPPVAPPSNPQPAAAGVARLPPSVTAQDARPWFARHQRLLAVVAGGVGVAGVGVGTAFGLMAKPTYDKSAADCNGDVCGPSGHDYRESAFTKAEISTVAFGIGAAGLIGGAVLWLTAPKASPSASAALVTPSVGPSVAMLNVQRSW